MDLYVILAVTGALVGVAITGTAVYTAWYIHKERNRPDMDGQLGFEVTTQAHNPPYMKWPSEASQKFLMKWSAFDYAVVLLFLMGMVFLLADLAGMIRERLNYPLFHYGYLLCGFIFTLISMIFMVVRLGVVLRISNSGGLRSPHHHKEPEHTHKTE